MEEEEEAVISELKKQLEDEDLNPEKKMVLLNEALNKVLNSAAVQTDCRALSRVQSRLFLSGVLGHCVQMLSVSPGKQRRAWSRAVQLAHLTSSSCVGAELRRRSEAFKRLFLPSVMDALLSLACRLMSRAECSSGFRKVMDFVGWLLASHTHLTAQVLSSAHYEQIQMCDDVSVSLLCIQMWIQTSTVNRDFLSDLSDESVLLLLNEAVAQLALSSNSAVGGASIGLMITMANKLGLRLKALLLNFKGLDSLLEKDWRGRGFDQDVDQLISFIQSEVRTERVRAACVIQAAWRSFQTRRRVRSLNRAVSSLQRSYRARRRRLEEQEVAQQWEEQLRYQVCVRRQQARRRFHQKQRELLLLLPADQVRPYLQECERRAAVVIQSAWRGFRERRRYNESLRDALRERQKQQRAARTLQRPAGRLLEKRPSAIAPPLTALWIGQEGLTEGRWAELKQQVENYISVHKSLLSAEECASLHEEAQRLLQAELQRGEQHRREEQRAEALMALVHTQLELLRDAPPLSVVTPTQAESILSPSACVAARARDAHNTALQAARLPWWRTLGGMHMEEETGPAHLQELEAELGGLFIGGLVAVKGGTKVDGGKLDHHD